jgi:hypothetical protein
MRIRSLALIAIILTFLFLISCAPEPLSIGSITVCKDVGEDYSPVNPTDEFPPDTSVIYISVGVNNMTPEDKITVTLIYMETGDEIKTTDFTTEEAGSGYKSFKIVFDQGFPAGEYNAEVYLNDEIYEMVRFTVK